MLRIQIIWLGVVAKLPFYRNFCRQWIVQGIRFVSLYSEAPTIGLGMFQVCRWYWHTINRRQYGTRTSKYDEWHWDLDHPLPLSPRHKPFRVWQKRRERQPTGRRSRQRWQGPGRLEWDLAIAFNATWLAGGQYVLISIQWRQVAEWPVLLAILADETIVTGRLLLFSSLIGDLYQSGILYPSTEQRPATNNQALKRSEIMIDVNV